MCRTLVGSDSKRLKNMYKTEPVAPVGKLNYDWTFGALRGYC